MKTVIKNHQFISVKTALLKKKNCMVGNMVSELDEKQNIMQTDLQLKKKKKSESVVAGLIKASLKKRLERSVTLLSKRQNDLKGKKDFLSRL